MAPQSNNTQAAGDETTTAEKEVLVAESQVFRLMDLAAELRIKIYTCAFKQEGLDEEPLQYLCLPALTRVSRQIRQESIPVFFDTTIFLVFVGSNIGQCETTLIMRKAIRNGSRHANRYKQRLDETSRKCGAMDMCPRAAKLLLLAKEGAVMRNVKLAAISAGSFIRCEIPWYIRGFREGIHDKRLKYIEHETLLHTHLSYERGKLTTETLPANEEDFAKLTTQAASLDKVVTTTKAKVAAKAQEIAGRVNFKGFTWKDLEVIAREFEMEPMQGVGGSEPVD